MNASARRREIRAAIGTFLAAALIATVAVVLAGCGSTSPGTTTPGTSPSTTAPAMTVKVFFHKGSPNDPAQVTAVTRTVPRTAQVPAAALTQLLAGPTAAERNAGYWSFFSDRTAQMLRSLRIASGVAHADFKDFSKIIPNASSSFGSAALMAELDTTLRQFSSVRSTMYSFNGDDRAFYDWLQMAPPAEAGGAVAAARDFLRQIAGMQDLVPSGTRWVSTGVFQVDLRSGSATGPVTTVLLAEGTTSWMPVSAETAAIRVDEPRRLQRITSPVTISGQSSTFEGQFLTRVLQDNGGTFTELGRTNTITGGSTGMAPFHGQVSFTRPSAVTGWLVLTYQSAKTGATEGATAVQVRFTTVHAAPPRIEGMQVTSGQPIKDGWLMLPDGPGTLTIAVQTTGAERVKLYITPTGTGTAPFAKLIGESTVVNGTATLTWHYADEPLSDHITVVATGPGGRAEDAPFNIAHP